MELKEIKNISDQMIEHFINSLGMDGKYYVNSMKCPVMYGPCFGLGEFISAESNLLKKRLDKAKIPEEIKEKIFHDGLIIISNEFKNKEASNELITTLIHETFHANRMLLVKGHKKNADLDDVITFDDHFAYTTDEYKDYYADANQEIFHGSVDTSRQTADKINSDIDKYQNMSLDDNIEVDNQNSLYQMVDESLVELMALTAFYLIKNKTDDVMEIVRRINKHAIDLDLGDDIKSMSNIILRHNDLDLFKWMIDPLTYQLGDINYDYFNHYINEEDKKDIEIIQEFGLQDADEFFEDINNKINK